METVTIWDLLSEMTSFVKVDREDLEKAQISDITNQNSGEFNQLLNDWVDMKYDEDPELLVQRLTAML